MTNKEMKEMIERTADAARLTWKKYNSTDLKIIDINHGLPYVGINCNDGSEYFFQDEAASEILEEATNTANKFNVSIEDAIIWAAQSW
jgi:protoheme ferro-lyase